MATRKSEFDWSPPPVSADDQRLIDAYLHIGRPVDDLPYTSSFETLVKKLGVADSQDARHHVFRRLLTLRKMGLLARAGSAYANF